MKKLNINDLHYVVMEGGGARGNIHLGAVKALEDQLEKRMEDVATTVETADVNVTTRQGRLSIMDYLETNQKGELVPVIQGVAGTSAGAIASFALALGLNSEEINEVMSFDFKNFLSEKDPAKYRMIGEDSSLMVGEDSGLSRKVDPQQVVKKTMGGKKSKKFDYKLDKNKTIVIGNFLKKQARAIGINFFLDSIFSGLANNLGKIIPYLNKLSEKYKAIGDISKALTKFFSFTGKSAGAIGIAGQRMIYKMAIRWVVFRGLSFGTPMKVDTDVIAGLIWDRGMFSGFQVREFFYDVMIYAATRDTLFQRSLISAYSEKDIRVGKGLNKVKLTKENLSYPDFKIGKRKKTDFNDEAKALFTHLQNLTFEEYFEVMGVDYTCSVSNFTADTMLYFSYRWTPQFRMLEAVGGSMTIPPAIRPLYNASDVYFDMTKDGGLEKFEFPRDLADQTLNVKVEGKFEEFVDGEGQFTQSNYNLYEHIVKTALQSHIGAKEKSPTFISLNNGIEVVTFLDDLRQIVIGNYPKKGRGKPIKVPLSMEHRKVMVDKVNYYVSDELLAFYYNAQFKGNFIDGGYRNNIPINHYRAVLGDLNEVLTIKLDRSFPHDFMVSIHANIASFLKFEKEILAELENELYDSRLQGVGNNVFQKLQGEKMDEINVQYELLIAKVTLSFEAYLIKQEKYINKDIEGKKFQKIRKAHGKYADRRTILKLIKTWIEFNGKENYVKPWAVSKSILATAMEGYAYGMERGQVRYQTDHANFIPLYDFGVGTYDFKLKKVRALARMSQEIAYKDVTEYFEVA